MGVMSEGLASVDVAEVNFDEGNQYRVERIADGDAGVGIGGGVDQQAVEAGARRLEPIDDFPFDVGLVEGNLDVQGSGELGQAPVDPLKALAAVDLGLALTEEVEIGAVQNPYAQRFRPLSHS